MNFYFPRNRQYFFAIVLPTSGVLSLSNSAFAQVSLSSISYSQNFDSMGSTGTTTPTGWTVDSTTNAAASGTSTDAPVNTGTVVGSSTTVLVGTGSSTTGGNYNFGVAGTNPATDCALRSLASAGNQRDTYVSFTNNTGFSIRPVYHYL